jgi:hypothetical protein
VADVMVSTSMADIYMLVPILWVPLDFLDDVIVRLRRLLGISPALLLIAPGDRYCCYRFTPSCGVRQTTLHWACGGRGLFRHALIGL